MDWKSKSDWLLFSGIRRVFFFCIFLTCGFPAVYVGQMEDLQNGFITSCCGCDLTSTIFGQADLSGVDFTVAILVAASFHLASISGADFTNVSAVNT